ncbi:MAG TPA: alanine racemase, partial [Candidatus Lokiarchaeia archaeon]|nr:alanine racemase [Candidatus Lokiarchaeia archaeon]
MSPNAVAPKFSFRYPLETLQQVLADETCPCAFLDLETFDENLDFLSRELEKIGRDVKIRIGTKSLRVPTLINRALQRSYCAGLLLFNAGEIQFLQENYGVTDFLLAYPVLGRREADLLAAGAQRDPAAVVTAMVDCPVHLELLEQSAAAIDVTLSVCIDVDMGISFLKQLAGVMRTPLQTPEQVVNLARQLEHFPHLKFRGIMGYEAQEASIGDSSYIMRQMKKASRGLVPQKREAAVQALADAGFKTEIVNGGGSGCF